jgi:hypothetical protein
MGGSLLKRVFSVMGWTSRTRLQHAFQCSASSRIGGRGREAITTTWPLPTIACRVVGLSRQTVRSLSLPPLRGRSVRQDHRGAEDLRFRERHLLPVHTMRFTSEDASHAAWLVAEQLLQGCPKIFPSVDITPGVHSQHPRPLRTSRERDTALLGAFGVGLLSPPRVPSSWFYTTPTACSTDSSQACCILLPTLGFIGFLRLAVCRLALCASPPMHHPPELIHLQSRFPVTRDRYPPAVPGVRPLGWGACRLQGLAPCKRP